MSTPITDLTSQIVSDLGESPAVSPDAPGVSEAPAEETPPVSETEVSATPAETLSGFIATSGLEEAQAINLLREAQQFVSPEGQAKWNQHLSNVLAQQVEAQKPKIFQEYLGAALKTPEGIQSLESMLRRVKGEPEQQADLSALDDLDEGAKSVFKGLMAKVAALEAQVKQAPQVTQDRMAQEQAVRTRQAQEFDGYLQTHKDAVRFQELIGEDLREAIQRDGARFQTPGAVAQEADRIARKYARAGVASGAPARPKPPLPAPRGSAQGVGPPQPKRPQNEDDWTKSIIEQMDSMGRG